MTTTQAIIILIAIGLIAIFNILGYREIARDNLKHSQALLFFILTALNREGKTSRKHTRDIKARLTWNKKRQGKLLQEVKRKKQ